MFIRVSKSGFSRSDNNFDVPDRTFHSLETTWRLSSAESTTDVKELVPEFFSLPEFLINREGWFIGLVYFPSNYRANFKIRFGRLKNGFRERH